MPRSIFILALIQLMAICTYCQNFRIIHWGIENGLSQGINQKIIKDKEGFLWITSYEGVNRFDGKTFRNFYSSPRKRTSIRGVETTGLVLDSLGKVWIGSGDGLNRYDAVADSMISFTSQKNAQGKVQYIIPVVATKTEVICFEMNGSLVAYNVNSFARRIVTNALKWHENYVNVNNSWYDSKKNELWMPAASGVAIISIENGDLRSVFPGEKINAITQGTNGMLFFGTGNGLIQARQATGANVPLENNFERRTTLKGSSIGKVTALTHDKDGRLWIGTEEKGIFIMTKDSIQHFEKTSGQLNSIAANKINTIFCDEKGIAWVGVATNGIDQFIPGHRFIHFSDKLESGSKLNNNIVRSFVEDKDRKIWITTQGGGINIFDPAEQQFTALTRKNTPGLPFDFVRYIAKEDDDHMLVGTEKGMCRINVNSKATQKIQFRRKDGSQLTDPYVEHIIPFRDNSWLVATKEFGLFILKRSQQEAVQEDFPGNKHVYYVAYQNNKLFVCIWDDEPKIFDVNGSMVPVGHDLNAFTISYVLYDAGEKKYWVGTTKGMLELDDHLQLTRHYTPDDGLSNHYVYAMVQDKNGLIWLSTNKGLSVFNTKTKTFKVYTPADGLQGYEYNAKAAFRSSDNSLYFGGINGFDRVMENDRSLTQQTAKYYIRQLLVNNVPFTGNTNINYTRRIELPYFQNNITIQSSVIDYLTAGNNQIRYKLEGADDAWKTADRDFIINYSGLPPGKYTFKAVASTANDVWEETGTTLEIHIANPWWSSLWFRIAGAVILIGSFVIGVRSYYRRKLERHKIELEKQQAIEKERTRIATDMHDDLGAGLSRIKFLSETIGIKKQQMEPIEEDIGKIKEYSHQMIDKMGEIVWALNERNDSINDLISYTRSYAVEYLSQNGIDCSINTPENSPTGFVSGEFRRNVFLTVKEALHNIVKHSGAKKVEMIVDATDQLYISIHDDGSGFDAQKTRGNGNGLFNMKKRIAAIGGVLRFKHEEGTKVVMEVPIPI